MNTTKTILLSTVFMMTACVGLAGEAGDDFRSCEPIAIFVDTDLSVTDMMTGERLSGPVIAVNAYTDIQCASGVTIGGEPCTSGIGGELKLTPSNQGDGFSCSCVDANAVKWTQACGPPDYGCTECCAGSGGETTRIKIYPNGGQNQCD